MEIQFRASLMVFGTDQLREVRDIFTLLPHKRAIKAERVIRIFIEKLAAKLVYNISILGQALCRLDKHRISLSHLSQLLSER